MQARFYLPMYGRFGSPDPKLDQHFQDTQSWNIYSYVRNNPVMNTDPDGMESVGQYLDQAGQSAYEKGNYGSWVGLGFLNAAYKVFTPGGDSLSDINSRAWAGETISNKELLKTGGLATAQVLLTAAPGVVQSRMALAAKAAAGAEAVTTGGAQAVRTGQAGEAAVRAAFDIGKKEMIDVGGRMRIPDGLTNTVLSEVKNVKSLSMTSQIRDFMTYAQQNGLRFDLYVRDGAKLSKPLLDAAQKGLIHLRTIPK